LLSLKLPFTKFKPLFKQRNFALVSVSESISSLGNMAQGIALAAYVFTLTQSIIVYSAFLLIRFAPQFVLFSLAGSIADRYSRRYITTIINILLGIFSSLMAINSENTSIILIMSLLMGIVDLPYRPALLASIPGLVKKDQLPLANGFMGVLNGLARIIGALFAAVGLLTDGVVWLLAFNALTFFIAGIIAWISLPTENVDEDNSKEESSSNEEQRLLNKKGLAASFSYLWGHHTLKYLVFGSFLVWGCLSLTDVLLVPLLNATVDNGEKYYGLYRLIASIGMLLGSYFTVSWRDNFIRLQRVPYGYAIPLLIMSLCTIGLSLSPIIFGPICYLMIWVALFLPSNLLEVELQLTSSINRGKVIALADALDGILFITLTGVLPQLNHFVNVRSLLWLSALPFTILSIVWIIGWFVNGRRLKLNEKETMS